MRALIRSNGRLQIGYFIALFFCKNDNTVHLHWDGIRLENQPPLQSLNNLLVVIKLRYFSVFYLIMSKTLIFRENLLDFSNQSLYVVGFVLYSLYLNWLIKVMYVFISTSKLFFGSYEAVLFGDRWYLLYMHWKMYCYVKKLHALCSILWM